MKYSCLALKIGLAPQSFILALVQLRPYPFLEVAMPACRELCCWNTCMLLKCFADDYVFGYSLFILLFCFLCKYLYSFIYVTTEGAS